MSAIQGTYKNGQIILTEPVDWPDGKRVIISPADDPPTTGMTEEEQGEDAESNLGTFRPFRASRVRRSFKS